MQNNHQNFWKLDLLQTQESIWWASAFFFPIALGYLARVWDNDLLPGFSIVGSSSTFYCVDNVHALNNLAQYNMLPIQPAKF